MDTTKINALELNQVKKSIQILLSQRIFLGHVYEVFKDNIITSYIIKFDNESIPEVEITIGVFNYLRAKNKIVEASPLQTKCKFIFQLIY